MIINVISILKNKFEFQCMLLCKSGQGFGTIYFEVIAIFE